MKSFDLSLFLTWNFCEGNIYASESENKYVRFAAFINNYFWALSLKLLLDYFKWRLIILDIDYKWERMSSYRAECLGNERT